MLWNSRTHTMKICLGAYPICYDIFFKVMTVFRYNSRSWRWSYRTLKLKNDPIFGLNIVFCAVVCTRKTYVSLKERPAHVVWSGFKIYSWPFSLWGAKKLSKSRWNSQKLLGVHRKLTHLSVGEGLGKNRIGELVFPFTPKIDIGIFMAYNVIFEKKRKSLNKRKLDQESSVLLISHLRQLRKIVIKD